MRHAEFSIVLQDFDGIAPARVLKHCSTRWLSLERALNRLLLLWPALFAYFNREIDNSDQDRQYTGLLKTEPIYWSPENRANILVS